MDIPRQIRSDKYVFAFEMELFMVGPLLDPLVSDEKNFILDAPTRKMNKTQAALRLFSMS